MRVLSMAMRQSQVQSMAYSTDNGRTYTKYEHQIKNLAENLDAFYDYEKYGTEHMNAEDGMFTDRGYIAYKGYYSMEKVMNGSQSSRMEMGGMM